MSDSTKNMITIRIDIPVDVADETIVKLECLAVHLKDIVNAEPSKDPSIGFVTPVDKEREAALAKEADDRRQEFKRRIVQAFRKYRRLTKSGKTEKQAFGQIALEYDWPNSIAKDITTSRRVKINHYMRFRRMKTAIKMAAQGISEPKIAKHVGVSQSTVNRMLQEARKQKVGGLS